MEKEINPGTVCLFFSSQYSALFALEIQSQVLCVYGSVSPPSSVFDGCRDFRVRCCPLIVFFPASQHRKTKKHIYINTYVRYIHLCVCVCTSMLIYTI